MILGDLGAEVLKIEEPRVGDYGRWEDTSRTEERVSFMMTNRNKKSMKLNLKRETGKDIFKQLAASYDVLIESFRPGVMDGLGLGYKDIQRVNPAIIYCSTTGYGQTGPYRDKPGHDINYLSISGILACTGEHTGRPVIPGVPFGDMAGGGVFPALAIIAALFGRVQNGKGQYIDTSQTDVLTSFNIVNIAEALSGRKGRKKTPYNVWGGGLCYNTYRTSDGKFIALGAIEPKFWRNLCKAVGRENWIKKNLSAYEEGDKTTEEIKDLFASKTQKEWIEILKTVDTCLTPVLIPEETMEDIHLKEREIITTMEDPQRGEILQVGFPAIFSDGLHFKRSPAPFFGEHTREVLADLGYTSLQIERFEKDGVI